MYYVQLKNLVGCSFEEANFALSILNVVIQVSGLCTKWHLSLISTSAILTDNVRLIAIPVAR